MSAIELGIHHVRSVEVERREHRDDPQCDDFDRYRVTITTEAVDGKPLTALEFNLFTEPGEDIGLEPLFDLGPVEPSSE